MNVLITSASRKVGLVRVFQEALSDIGGGEVIAVDADPYSPALYFADKHYLVPPSQNREFLDVILALCRRLKVTVLIPTRDEELPLFSEHKAAFAELGTLVMVSEPDTVRICQDKQLFIDFCREEGFSTPRNYIIKDLSAEAPVPLFLKPRYGKGGQGAIVVNSKEELELALRQIPDPIIQEFIRASEYTVDFFSDLSGRVISVVPRQRISVFGGESFVAKTSKNAAIIRAAVLLGERLKLLGHNTIQCFLRDEQVLFIEVNPRFGGAAHLGFAAGAPTPLFLLKMVKGERIEPRIGDFKDNYVMLRYTEDIFIQAESEFSKKNLL